MWNETCRPSAELKGRSWQTLRHLDGWVACLSGAISFPLTRMIVWKPVRRTRDCILEVPGKGNIQVLPRLPHFQRCLLGWCEDGTDLSKCHTKPLTKEVIWHFQINVWLNSSFYVSLCRAVWSRVSLQQLRTHTSCKWRLYILGEIL